MYNNESKTWIEKYIRGAIYGLLVGDAVGVPYEFKVPSQLPDIEQIDMIPQKDLRGLMPVFQLERGQMMVHKHYVCWPHC